jgi:hypothetical protein
MIYKMCKFAVVNVNCFPKVPRQGLIFPLRYVLTYADIVDYAENLSENAKIRAISGVLHFVTD